MTLTITSLQNFFTQYQHTKKFVVAFSGGLDSTVLLYGMHTLNLPIQAVHINHHLQNECDQWELHCKNLCNLWGIELFVRQVEVNKISNKSIEENARTLRYSELFKFVSANDCLVTAHHKDDLAETFLLQLLRGAGPVGLSAMSTEQKISKGLHLRPLLGYTRSEIFEFAKLHSLSWLDDPSNESLDFDRNYLRKNVMPVIVKRWPGAVQTIARASELQADSMNCLRELANLDLQNAVTNDSTILDITALQKLSDERLINALRGWVRNHDMRSPNKKLMGHIVKDIVRKEELESSPVQTWLDGEVRRYRNRIYLMKPLSIHDATQEFEWNVKKPLYIESLNLTLNKSDLEQLAIQLPDEVLTVRFRTGGERLKPIGKSHHRSLKNLFQEANIPPWERDRIPLLYHKDILIAVLGYWSAAVECET